MPHLGPGFRILESFWGSGVVIACHCCEDFVTLFVSVSPLSVSLSRALSLSLSLCLSVSLSLSLSLSGAVGLGVTEPWVARTINPEGPSSGSSRTAFRGALGVLHRDDAKPA